MQGLLLLGNFSDAHDAVPHSAGAASGKFRGRSVQSSDISAGARWKLVSALAYDFFGRGYAMEGMPQAAGLKPASNPAADPLLVVVDKEANLPNDNQQERNPRSQGNPWLTILMFAFLSFNSVMAVIKSQGDMGAILFVGFSYIDLVLLFGCLRLYERAPAGSSSRDRLKVAVWILTTLLTVAFSYKVAAVMPPAAAVVVWVMAFATVAGGFFAFFLYKEKN